MANSGFTNLSRPPDRLPAGRPAERRLQAKSTQCKSKGPAPMTKIRAVLSKAARKCAAKSRFKDPARPHVARPPPACPPSASPPPALTTATRNQHQPSRNPGAVRLFPKSERHCPQAPQLHEFRPKPENSWQTAVYKSGPPAHPPAHPPAACRPFARPNDAHSQNLAGTNPRPVNQKTHCISPRLSGKTARTNCSKFRPTPTYQANLSIRTTGKDSLGAGTVCLVFRPGTWAKVHQHTCFRARHF